LYFVERISYANFCGGLNALKQFYIPLRDRDSLADGQSGHMSTLAASPRLLSSITLLTLEIRINNIDPCPQRKLHSLKSIKARSIVSVLLPLQSIKFLVPTASQLL
jgi:hypothetical protein